MDSDIWTLTEKDREKENINENLWVNKRKLNLDI
jgi:hypothetical protein